MNEDSLESLLRSSGSTEQCPGVPPPDLTERVLQITERRQRRRRRRKTTAGFVGCYVGGLLTMWICVEVMSTRTPAPNLVTRQNQRPPPRIRLDTQKAVPREPKSAVNADYRLSPQRDTSPQRDSLYGLFSKLGDISHARGDYESALSNYRLALDFASQADLVCRVDEDNLLLLALKRERTNKKATVSAKMGESI